MTYFAEDSKESCHKYLATLKMYSAVQTFITVIAKLINNLLVFYYYFQILNILLLLQLYKFFFRSSQYIFLSKFFNFQVQFKFKFSNTSFFLVGSVNFCGQFIKDQLNIFIRTFLTELIKSVFGAFRRKKCAIGRTSSSICDGRKNFSYIILDQYRLYSFFIRKRIT